MITFRDVLDRAERDLQELHLYPPLPNDLPEPDILNGNITAHFKANQCFHDYTGFSENVITTLVEAMLPISMNARQRGPQPRSSLSDSLLCYLCQMRSSMDVPLLAKILHLSENRFSNNVDRIRPILNDALKNLLVDHVATP